MVIKRDRGDYAAAVTARRDATIEIDVESIARAVVEMPESYARDLLAEISEISAAKADDDDNYIEIRVDLPVRLTLSPQQLTRLIEHLDYKLRRARLQEVP